MYKILIKEYISSSKEVIIREGEHLLNEDGTIRKKQATKIIKIKKIDKDGNLLFNDLQQPVYKEIEEKSVDENGNPIMEPVINNKGYDVNLRVKKTQEEIEEEKQVFINNKTKQTQAEVDIYKTKQEYQKKHGGPGPVATEEIMKIVNEYNGQFEVVFKEE